jgi:hypothetical protein
LIQRRLSLSEQKNETGDLRNSGAVGYGGFKLR